jgi:hypothetical protein
VIPKFKTNDKVVVIPELRTVGRFEDIGIVLGYTNDPFWLNKGTPVIVEYDYGPAPADWTPGPLFSKWHRYKQYYFCESELTKWNE